MSDSCCCWAATIFLGQDTLKVVLWKYKPLFLFNNGERFPRECGQSSIKKLSEENALLLGRDEEMRACMPVDLQRYRSHALLAGLSDAEKDDIIRTIALTLKPFVERAFGLHSVQLSLGINPRKFNEIMASHAILDRNSINLEPQESAIPTAGKGRSP